MTMKTVQTALDELSEVNILVGRIEQLENWWPDKKDIEVLAGTYIKPTLGRKRKQAAPAGQSVSSAHTASFKSRGRPREQTASAESDESPPRKRAVGGSIILTVKKQPTARRKRPRVLDSSEEEEEEEEDDPTAAEDPADKGPRPDDGSRTQVCTYACCLAGSVIRQLHLTMRAAFAHLFVLYHRRNK